MSMLVTSSIWKILSPYAKLEDDQKPVKAILDTGLNLNGHILVSHMQNLDSVTHLKYIQLDRTESDNIYKQLKEIIDIPNAVQRLYMCLGIDDKPTITIELIPQLKGQVKT